MELTDIEKLAVLTALQKAIKAQLDEVRARADASMLECYEEDGVVKKAMKLGGVKVGDYIVVLTADDWAVTDTDALNDFALTYGFARQDKHIKEACMPQAIKIIEELDPFLLAEDVVLNGDWKNFITNTGGVPTFLDSGEVVPGIELVGARVKCTQVRGCKPDDVVPRMRELGGVDQLLLGAPALNATTEGEAA